MIITANYNWKGKLSSYTRDNSSIPIARGNADYEEILRAINDGICTILEPTFENAEIAYDKNNNPSGYLINIGFVPNDKSNYLTQLIETQIASGKCKIINSIPVNFPYPKFKKIICIIVLDSSWPHIQDCYSYEPSIDLLIKSKKYSHSFKLKNLSINNLNQNQVIYKNYNLNEPYSNSKENISFGLIEIEIAVSDLRKLFKKEKQYIQEWMKEFFEDDVQKHYIQTRRSRKEGPDISWLILNASIYLKHYLIEYRNSIVEIFSSEYGDTSNKFISEKNTIINL